MSAENMTSEVVVNPMTVAARATAMATELLEEAGLTGFFSEETEDPENPGEMVSMVTGLAEYLTPERVEEILAEFVANHLIGAVREELLEELKRRGRVAVFFGPDMSMEA